MLEKNQKSHSKLKKKLRYQQKIIKKRMAINNVIIINY